VRGGSGGGGARRGPARVGQAVGAGAGGHVARRGAARGQLGLGKWPAKAAGPRVRAEPGGGTRGRRRRTGLEFSKNAGTPM
jgi:hypothetical protein